MAIVTASPKTMGRLVELQEASLGELATIRETLVSGGSVEVVSKHTEAIEKLTESNEDLIKQNDINYSAIEEVANNFKIIKTPLEKMGDKFDSLKDTLSDPKRMALNMLPNFLGGIKERAVQKNDFVKAQRALGSEKSNAELAADFKESRKAAKDMQAAAAELAKLSKLTGLSEDKLANTQKGSALIAAKNDASARLTQNDLRASMAAGAVVSPAAPAMQATPTVTGVTATPPMPAVTPAEAKEASDEQAKQMNEQTDLLREIAAALTGKGTNGTNGGGAEDSSGGNGLLSSFGGKIDTLDKSVGKKSNGLIKGAAALVLISGAVWIAADAFTKFSEVEWEDVGKGLTVLGGLVIAARALGKATPQMIIGAIGLGLLSGALWLAGEAMSGFAELDWETIGKGLVAIGGIGLIGAAAGAAAPLLIAGAAGLAALGGSAWIIGEAMQAIGQGIKDMVDGLERLSALDGDRLIKVGDGITSISGAIALFGAGQAAAGLGTLVGNLLTIGQDSPIEQFEKLANMSEGLVRAGTGMRSISNAIAGFSEMDPASIRVLDEVPWGDMEDFADEDGVMIMEKAGAKYTVGSGRAMAEAGAFTPAMAAPNIIPVGAGGVGVTAETASVNAQIARDVAVGGSRSSTNVVNAPVTNSSTTAVTYRPPIRNTNPSGGRFAGRFGR